jgi:iron(III) transport system ATP-binding protein
VSIEFFNLSKSFSPEKSVLSDLNFTLPKNQFSGLLGPSGCGKTTLLRILAGLETASTGKITVEEEVWSDTNRKYFLKPEKRNVGMVFQSYAIWPHMTIYDNVAFPLKMHKVSKHEIKSKVHEYIKIVGLEGFETRFPDSLSGGQQQRVALARALIQNPKLLLLDEPLSNLDANLRQNMRKEIRRIQQDFSITSIIVTHDWADAQTLCDQIIILNNGKIEQTGTPSEIFNNPKTEFVKSLIKHHY